MNLRTVIEISLLSLLCFLQPPCLCLSAEEEAAKELPSHSPDQTFLIRMPNEAEREKLGENDLPKPGLYEVKSGRHVACLPLDSMEGFVDSLRVVWSKDSTRVGFNFRAGGRYYTTLLCGLKAGESIDLPSPEDLLLSFLNQDKAARIKQMRLKKDVYQRRIHDEVTLRRWMDENTIEADAHSISTVSVQSKEEDAEPDTVDVEAKWRFTLKWDANEQEWKIVKSIKLKNE
jgi:hypothetical protein